MPRISFRLRDHGESGPRSGRGRPDLIGTTSEAGDAVANYFEKDKRGNAANRAITAIDSSNNIVFEENGTTIALLGVH
jgi:hypothetical protein